MGNWVIVNEWLQKSLTHLKQIFFQLFGDIFEIGQSQAPLIRPSQSGAWRVGQPLGESPMGSGMLLIKIPTYI